MKYMQIPIPQKPRPNPEISEWKYDEFGRKYRKVGSCIEYAPTITVDGVEVYQDELEEFNRNRKAAMEKQRQQEREAAAQVEHTKKICPFNDPAHFQKECTSKCALYRPTGCAQGRNTDPADTVGKECPYLRQCKPDCALYNQGCTL